MAAKILQYDRCTSCGVPWTSTAMHQKAHSVDKCFHMSERIKPFRLEGFCVLGSSAQWRMLDAAGILVRRVSCSYKTQEELTVRVAPVWAVLLCENASLTTVWSLRKPSNKRLLKEIQECSSDVSLQRATVAEYLLSGEHLLRYECENWMKHHGP